MFGNVVERRALELDVDTRLLVNAKTWKNHVSKLPISSVFGPACSRMTTLIVQAYAELGVRRQSPTCPIKANSGTHHPLIKKRSQFAQGQRFHCNGFPQSHQHVRHLRVTKDNSNLHICMYVSLQNCPCFSVGLSVCRRVCLLNCFVFGCALVDRTVGVCVDVCENACSTRLQEFD